MYMAPHAIFLHLHQTFDFFDDRRTRGCELGPMIYKVIFCIFQNVVMVHKTDKEMLLVKRLFCFLNL